MSRPLIALMFLIGAALATVILMVGDIQIRPSGGVSFSARELQASVAQPVGRNASKQTTSVDGSMTQAQTFRPSRQTAPSPVGAGSGPVNKAGIMGGVFDGFVGAGLIGMVLGYGILGGLSNLASVFGLCLQAALVGAVALRTWMWWQRRQEFAAAGGPALDGIDVDTESGPRETASEMARSFGKGLADALTGKDAAVKLNKFDYDDFERLLGEILHAYGAQDLNIVRARVTPEMFSKFSEQIEHNASQGVINQVSNVRLLQGDLAESWHEADQDFASVAMRYSIINTTVERATGRRIDGSASPMEITETWTFVRSRYGSWRLSAMQQN